MGDNTPTSFDATSNPTTKLVYSSEEESEDDSSDEVEEKHPSCIFYAQKSSRKLTFSFVKGTEYANLDGQSFKFSEKTAEGSKIFFSNPSRPPLLQLETLYVPPGILTLRMRKLQDDKYLIQDVFYASPSPKIASW